MSMTRLTLKTPFAILAETKHGPILIEATHGEETDYKPAIRIRMDFAVTVEVTRKDWEDTPEGWDARDKVFNEMDPIAIADEMAARFDNIMNDG